MKRLAAVAPLAVAAVALASCGGASNPKQLWLAPNGDELHVQLLPIEPHPF